MSSRIELVLASLVAAVGFSACRGPTIKVSLPAIQVELQSDGTVIETFPQLQDGGLSFGSIPVLIPVQQTLTLTNLGTGILNIGLIDVTPDGGPFSVVGTLPTSVGGSGDAQLIVQFDPPAQQTYAAALEISSDDLDHPTVTIPLSGTGSTEGLLTVTPDPLDFGDVGQGQTQTGDLTLLSHGTAALQITNIYLADGGDPAFTVLSSTSIDGGILLDAGDQISPFVLSFSPTATTPANASGALVIVSSDPTHQPYVVPLTGQGILAPIPVISAPMTAAIGDTVTLDGTSSYDPNVPPRDPLTYQWQFHQKPGASTAQLMDLTDAQATVTLDVVGNYTFWLNVFNDAGVESVMPAVATVYAKPTDDLYVEMIWDNIPVDMDLHLLIDGGVFEGQGDCNSYDPDAGFSCTPGSDHLVGPGPEWIAVAVPEATDYEVECKLYDAHNATNDSTLVTVRVYVYGVLAAQLCQRLDSVGDVWPAVTVAWPSGTVTPIGSSVTCPATN